MPSSKSSDNVKELKSTKAPAKTTKKKTSGLVAVKNIGTKTLSLAGGPIEPSKTGEASPAEVAVLHEYLEKV